MKTSKRIEKIPVRQYRVTITRCKAKQDSFKVKESPNDKRGFIMNRLVSVTLCRAIIIFPILRYQIKKNSLLGCGG